MLCTFAPPLFSPCDSCHPHVLCLCSAHLHHLTHSPCHPSRAVTMTMNCSTPTEHAFRFVGLLEKTLQSPIEHCGHLDLGNMQQVHISCCAVYMYTYVYICTLACFGPRSIALESKGNKLSHFKLSQVSLIWLISSVFTEIFYSLSGVKNKKLSGTVFVNRRSYRFSPRWLMSRV